MTKATHPKQTTPSKTEGAIAISKAVNPTRLMGELHAIGVTGLIQKSGAQSFILLVKSQPSNVSAAQIQAVITAHDASPVADPAIAALNNWAGLSASEKDALMLAALKKLYQVR
jgi:hypothetical protein